MLLHPDRLFRAIEAMLSNRIDEIVAYHLGDYEIFVLKVTVGKETVYLTAGLTVEDTYEFGDYKHSVWPPPGDRWLYSALHSAKFVYGSEEDR